MMEAAKWQEDKVIQKTEEFSRKEEEVKQRAVQLEQETERMKQMQLAVQNFVEDLSHLPILAHNKYIWFPKNLLMNASKGIVPDVQVGGRSAHSTRSRII